MKSTRHTRSLLDELIQVSRRFGADPDFVLAGGGNTSVKDGNLLLVKASGASLAAIDASGFVRMDQDKLASLFSAQFSKNEQTRESEVLRHLMAARLPGEEQKRPSVETLLHALLPKKFVVHTHPALVNGLTCGRNGQAIATRLFGARVLWVPYTNPGYTLAARVQKLLAECKRAPDILLMENHGLIVSANTADEVEALSQNVLRLLRRQVRKEADLTAGKYNPELVAHMAPVVRMAVMDQTPGIVRFEANRAFSAFVRKARSFAPLLRPFTPDHMVYCQATPCFVPAKATLIGQEDAVKASVRLYREKHGMAPKVVAIQKLGVFAIGQDAASADIALSLFRDAARVAIYAANFGGPKPMTPRQVKFIAAWEVERYRRKVSLGNQTGARLTGKIAIVTGGAQGFGLGIVSALLREGAHVILADRNLAQAEQSATALEQRYGRGRVKAVAVDVGDDTSVRNMVLKSVITFGGMDLLVSNAGILKAGPLDTLTPADFDLVTRVNYTGFYLCTRHVAEIMKIQHRTRPGYWMDIVQVNSKSGLAGSKANFAYAGGKFGSIGLTQSFALELVDFHIKVNAICPGNLLDGPLWSDPVNGLFVQYLKAGKVPGARTVADVRRFYEAKVPMHRGCHVEDVTRALLYAVEQQYETGQAIPVTGGQNMLN